jgi:hypothetical protein
MQHFKSINVETTGELADALHAFPRGTRLKLVMGEGDGAEVQGMYGGIAEDGSYELHLDDEKDPRREARQKREEEAVRRAAGEDVELDYGESPAERKARARNQQLRETRRQAALVGGGVSDKFAEYGVKEAPDGQPTGAEDTAVREGQWDKYKVNDPRSPGEIVRHRRAVERAADEPQYGVAPGKHRVPLQKAEAAARNPMSQASAGLPLPERGPMSERAIKSHEADLEEQDAEARGEQQAEGKRPDTAQSAPKKEAAKKAAAEAPHERDGEPSDKAHQAHQAHQGHPGHPGHPTSHGGKGG